MEEISGKSYESKMSKLKPKSFISRTDKRTRENSLRMKTFKKTSTTYHLCLWKIYSLRIVYSQTDCVLTSTQKIKGHSWQVVFLKNWQCPFSLSLDMLLFKLLSLQWAHLCHSLSTQNHQQQHFPVFRSSIKKKKKRRDLEQMGCNSRAKGRLAY